VAERREPVVVGIVAEEGAPADLAAQLRDELAEELARDFEDVEWRVEARTIPGLDPSADAQGLIDIVRRHLLREGWELAVGLTDLPLKAGRRPVTAHASATHGVGLVSIPALGAIGRQRRLRSAAVHLVEGLVGEAVGEVEAQRGTRRAARMGGRVRELASPLGRAREQNDGSIRFVGAVLRGNLRLLIGMVRANEPSRVALRLSRAMVGALGAGAVAMAASDVWRLSNGMVVPRLVAVAMVAVLVSVVSLVLSHGLWERPGGARGRERVTLFNLVTAATLGLGVLCLFAGLLVVTFAGALVVIPPRTMTAALGHDVNGWSYVKLAVFTAALATIGGALGSLVESDDAVRAATYVSRSDARSEDAATTAS
jgi:hypothetical protein